MKLNILQHALLQAAGCNFSYSIKHVKWQTAPAILGPWVTFVKTRVSPSQICSSRSYMSVQSV